jgi:hypothetical protein
MQAQQILSGMTGVARIVETDELAKRIAALEVAGGNHAVL